MNNNIQDQDDIYNRFHIFYIHSSITEIVAMAIIKYKNIPAMNVIIMSNRNYVLDSELQNNYRCFNMQVFTVLELQMHSVHLTQLLNFITLITKKHPYEIYLPHLSRYIWKTLVLHCRCTKLNYIEEGTISYLKFAASEQERKEKNIFNLYTDETIKFFAIDYIKDFIPQAIIPEDTTRLTKLVEKVDFYSITNEAFPFAAENKINVGEFIDRTRFKAALNSNEDDNVEKIILIQDSFNSSLEFDNLYYKHLDRLFQFIKMYVNKFGNYEIYVKFHPSSTEYNKQLWLDKLNEYQFTTTEININLEAEFIAQTKPLHIFAVLSSALYYAKHFNDKHHCYSVCKALCAEPEIGEEHLNNMASNKVIEQTGAFSKITYI